MLIAAGVAAQGLLLRNAHDPEWHRGLRETAVVVCDTVTAKQLPKACRAICFPLLAENAIKSLRNYEGLISCPVPPLL